MATPALRRWAVTSNFGSSNELPHDPIISTSTQPFNESEMAKKIAVNKLMTT